MRKYEFWVDNEGKLVISEYAQLKSENERRIFRGSETYNIIKVLSSSSLISVTEDELEDRLILEYENYIINLNEANSVLSKLGMGPLAQKLKKHIEKVGIRQLPRKKVTRKNKHTKGKIIVGGIIIAIILAAAISMNKTQAQSDLEAPSAPEVVTTAIVSEKDKKIDDIVNISFDNFDEEEVKSVSIDYADRSDTEKAHITQAYYGNLISKYSKIYGMDPNLVLGIATQERGIHGTTIDEGGAIGLMQIQYNVWANQPISAYNFETGKRETFKINSEKLSNVEYNIKVGCMVLQNTMEYMDYNTLAAVQCYNMGYGNMKKILTAYSNDCGKSINRILKDSTDRGWLDYRNIINVGDQNYIEHVFSWMGENVGIKTIKNDGTLINLNVTNQEIHKKIC